METIINLSVIALVFVVIFLIERIFFKKEPTKEEIDVYQKKLNDNSLRLKMMYGLNLSYDARKEITKEKTFKQAISLMFSGVALAFILFILIIGDIYTLSLLGIIILSGTYLILAGLLKMVENKGNLLKVLAMIFFVGFIIVYIINEIIMKII